jgi:3-dehydroquinate synthase
MDSPADAVESLRTLKHAGVLIDRRVAALHAKALAPIIEGRPVLQLDADENLKTLMGVQQACTWLQEFNATRQSTLIAIGGGIIQDVATVASHLYYRGLKWHYLPTTLLGMSDSCIGAKGTINLNAYKNQLGAFHSPAHVYICKSFLETLAPRDIASGYGEILKLHFIGSAERLNEVIAAVDRDGLVNPQLPALIHNSLVVKQRVIEIDEYEKDLRRILNYGHTFGHALESVTHNQIPHGLGVAWGMDLINFISWKRGLLAQEYFQRVHDFIARSLPFRLDRAVSGSEVLDASRRDKKVADGHANLILAHAPGDLRVTKTPMDQLLESQITEYVNHYNVYYS